MALALMGERPRVLQICVVTLVFFMAVSFPVSVLTDFSIFVVFGGDTARAAVWKGIASGVRATARFLVCPFQGVVCDEIGRRSFILFAIGFGVVLSLISVLIPTVHVLVAAAVLNGLLINLTVPASLMIVEISRSKEEDSKVDDSKVDDSNENDSNEGDSSSNDAVATDSSRVKQISNAFAFRMAFLLVGILLGTAFGTVAYQALDKVEGASAGGVSINATAAAAETVEVAEAVCGNQLLGVNGTGAATMRAGGFALPPLVEREYYPTKLVLPLYVGIALGIFAFFFAFASLRETHGVLTTKQHSIFAGKSISQSLQAVNQLPALAMMFRSRLITCLSVTFFLQGAGQEGYLSTVIFYGSYKFGFRPVEQMALLLSSFVATLLSNVIVLPQLLKRGYGEFTLLQLACLSGIVMGVGLCFASTPGVAFIFASFPLLFAGYVVSLLKGMISNEFDHDEQSKLQGAIASATTLGAAFAPIVFSSAFAWGVNAIDDGNDCALTAANWRSGLPFMLIAVFSAFGLVAVAIGKTEADARGSAAVAPADAARGNAEVAAAVKFTS